MHPSPRHPRRALWLSNFPRSPVRTIQVEFPKTFECHPNGNSTKFKDIYGLPDCHVRTFASPTVMVSSIWTQERRFFTKFGHPLEINIDL